MERSKRPRLNVTQESVQRKRRKTTVANNQWISAFEDLSNELIYEIFDYLHFHHAFESFYDLNARFQHFFLYGNLPVQINLPLISNPLFRRYVTQIIQPHADRIQSLRISNHFSIDMYLYLLPMVNSFSRLEALTITDIELEHIQATIDSLFSLPLLASLIIRSIGFTRISPEIYQKIFRLPVLKYCQMCISIKRNLGSLSFATTSFSPIEHLVIDNDVSLNQIGTLLSYVPQLRRLSLNQLLNYGMNRMSASRISLDQLTNVSVQVHGISFNDFEILVRNFFRQVQILHFTTNATWFYSRDMEHLNASRWQQLILTDMPNLRVFDFQHKYRSRTDPINDQAYQTKINEFSSLFWMQRQWSFAFQYHKTKHHNNALFYSTNPYRRRNFSLMEKWACSSGFCSFDTVRQVAIQSKDAMELFLSCFPNANELTLTTEFDVSGRSFVNDLNRINPLRKLTQLTLQCRRLSWKKLIELLHFTPHIQTLQLLSTLIYPDDATLMQKNKRFKLVSDTNTVTNIIIDKEMTIERLQLLSALFPRLESLTMRFRREALEPIMSFLLSKVNKNTRRLSSLCIVTRDKALIAYLRNLIDSKDLLQNYTLKQTNQNLHLWW